MITYKLYIYRNKNKLKKEKQLFSSTAKLFKLFLKKIIYIVTKF